MSKSQQISIVFNYSNIVLTEAMQNLLNRGLNFSILPLKLDLTQVLVDYKKFERSTIWHEFWYGREQDSERKVPIFKTNKSNLPKNYTVPEGLRTFLGAIKSEILDPRNRNKVDCNLPQAEIQAIKSLIKLQREGQIIIKACDKGAGIIILNYKDYMRACYEHLSSVQIGENNVQRPYYRRVEDMQLQRVKIKIKLLLDEGLRDNIITYDEFKAMNPDDLDAAKFYCNFKVHKEHTPMTAPPPRPIISGSNSITRNIGVLVEHHINLLSNMHDSYLQDSPHFLREIRKHNQENILTDHDILVTMDVKALFTNILHKEGLESLKIKLDN